MAASYSVNGKNLTMFSFEGDFKTRPKVSLGGASKKVSAFWLFSGKMESNESLTSQYVWNKQTNSHVFMLNKNNESILLFKVFLLCCFSGGESLSAAPHPRRKKKKRGNWVCAVICWQVTQFKGALCNIYCIRAVNKQKNRALDARNSSLQELAWILDVL